MLKRFLAMAPPLRRSQRTETQSESGHARRTGPANVAAEQLDVRSER